MAEVAQKTEKLLSSGNSTTQTYVPKVTASAIGHGEGNVAQRFENARQSREERSRRRSNSERQRRSEQFQREKERALRKQNIEELLASDEEEHSQSKTYIPKFSGKVRGRFEEMAKQKEEGERKRAEEERRRRIERDMAERLLLERELAKKALQDKDDEEKEEAFRVSKGKDEIDANVSLSLAERLTLLQSPSTSKESVAGHGGSSSQPGRLMLSFEEQERRRREEEEWKAEEEARHRIEEERRSFVEARRSLATEEEGEAEEEEKYGVGLPDVVPSQRLDLDFEELLRRRIEVEQQRAEQERQVRMEEERKVMEEQKLLMEPDVVNESYEVRSREQDEIRKLSRSGTVKAKSLKNKFEKMEQLSEEEVQRKIAQERAKRRAMDEEVLEREVKDLPMAEEEEEVEEPQVVENPSVQRNGMRARILEMERTREAEEQRRIEEQKLLRMQFEQQEIDAALQQTIEEEGTTNGVDGAGLKDEALHSGAPWFKQPLKNLQVVDGEPVRLVVRVMAELEPEVTWWFEGELLNDGDDYRYEKRDNGTYSLFLHETFPDDTGEFLCRAENLHGSAASSCLLTIESRCPCKQSDDNHDSDCHSKQVQLHPVHDGDEDHDAHVVDNYLCDVGQRCNDNDDEHHSDSFVVDGSEEVISDHDSCAKLFQSNDSDEDIN